eukprot:gene26503-32027_t
MSANNAPTAKPSATSSLNTQANAALDNCTALLSKFASQLGVLADREKKIATIVSTFSELNATKTATARRTVNVGGEGFIHPQMRSMKGLLDMDIIDMLRCCLHPIWASFMIKDKLGNVYLDVDIEWMGELLDQVMEREGREPSPELECSRAKSMWQRYEARGFRHLKATDKIGYQIVRCFFCLGLSEEQFNQHIPSAAKQKLPSNLTHAFLTRDCLPDFVDQVKSGSTEAVSSLSVIVDVDIHDVPVGNYATMESLQCHFSKFYSQVLIVSIEKASNGQTYYHQHHDELISAYDQPIAYVSAGAGSSTERIMALTWRKLNREQGRMWLNTISVHSSTAKKYELFMLPQTSIQNNNKPELGITLGKSAREAFIHLALPSGKITTSTQNGQAASGAYPYGVVQAHALYLSSMTTNPVRLIPIYPIWYELHSPSIEKILLQRCQSDSAYGKKDIGGPQDSGNAEEYDNEGDEDYKEDEEYDDDDDYDGNDGGPEEGSYYGDNNEGDDADFNEEEEEEEEEEEDDDDEEDEEEDTFLLQQGHQALQNFGTHYEQWRWQLNCREYILLRYARFMRDYLFRCYGIPIPQRKYDEYPDGGVTQNNMLQHIEMYLQDIAANCVYASQSVDPIVYLNVGGMKLTVLRSSILRCFPESQLAVRISGRWHEQPEDVDEEGNAFYNLPKKPFKALISYIRAYALNSKLAKLFIEEEHVDALKETLNYLMIPIQAVPIVIV